MTVGWCQEVLRKAGSGWLTRTHSLEDAIIYTTRTCSMAAEYLRNESNRIESPISDSTAILGKLYCTNEYKPYWNMLQINIPYTRTCTPRYVHVSPWIIFRQHARVIFPKSSNNITRTATRKSASVYCTVLYYRRYLYIYWHFIMDMRWTWDGCIWMMTWAMRAKPTPYK